MRKLIIGAVVTALSLLGLAGGTAYAAAPGQTCNISYGENDTIISPGPDGCIVEYASFDDAVATIHAAMIAGKYVVANAEQTGFISRTASGYVVRVFDVRPDWA